MRKIEDFIEFILVGLFIYSLFELAYGVAGFLEESPTFLIPFRVNSTIIFIGLLVSLFAGAFFPLWDVGKHFNTVNVQEILQLERGYKVSYYLLTIGFLGLSCWCASSKLFDVWWWFGAVLCLYYLWWIGFSPIIKRNQARNQCTA